jgi:predicted glycosyltransferase involved in capsule biosynthesis
MLASIVIPFHTKRIDNTTQTIKFLEYYQSDLLSESELILVCQDRCGKIDSTFKQTKLINLNFADMWTAKQTNIGVYESCSENICILDSDRILPKGYMKQEFSSLQPKQMITTALIGNLSRTCSDRDILEKDYDISIEERTQNNTILMRNMFSGSPIFKKKDYLDAGGMDENIHGYGWADHDMTARMTRIGVEAIFRDVIELHLFHERKTYDTSSDSKKMFIESGLYYCRTWGLPIPTLLREEISRYTSI